MDEIKEQFKIHIFLKAISRKIFGSVLSHEENGTCYVGRLAVQPNMQNQGIGTALMGEIEKYYKPKRFELFVGSKSDKNIYLYQKLRYNIYETIKYECGDIENFYMEKRRPYMSKITATDTLELSIPERIQLVEDIWDTITAKASSVELTDEEKRIIDARLEKYHQSPELGSPWEDVYKRITSRL